MLRNPDSSNTVCILGGRVRRHGQSSRRRNAKTENRGVCSKTAGQDRLRVRLEKCRSIIERFFLGYKVFLFFKTAYCSMKIRDAVKLCQPNRNGYQPRAARMSFVNFCIHRSSVIDYSSVDFLGRFFCQLGCALEAVTVVER